MSMISLVIASIIRGWEDWQYCYWGLLPIGLSVIATVLVHHFFWKNEQDISAPIDELIKTEEGDAKVLEESDDAKGDEETGAAEVVAEATETA
mgnify:CR=1 FL=1